MNHSMKLSIQEIQKKYDFQWELLDVVISGRSMIDTSFGLSGFPLKTVEDADRFMRCYGYDLDDPIEKAEILGNIHEAIHFIRKSFLKPENPNGVELEIPRKILEVTDVRDLLLMASQSAQPLLRDWACAVLKVIHAIAHIDKDVRFGYFSDIQKQIFDRFYRAVQRDSKGGLFLGEREEDVLSVPLKAFETKPKKSRDSVLLKLLHKPENVAEDIFDRVGLRFITYNKIDALRVVKYLKDAMILMPANIKPSRSRNTLISLKALREMLPSYLEKVEQGAISEADLAVALSGLDFDSTAAGQEKNPHTKDSYRSIQFTGRQLIKFKNPLFEDLRELRSLTKSKSMDPDVLKAIEKIDTKYLQREIRFFYPFEVQVMDHVTYQENEEGRGAHGDYKKSQVHTAMKRALGRLVE